MESLRLNDASVEKEVSLFLDKYVYPRYLKSWERFSDRESQLAGVDVLITVDGLEAVIVDEKAQSHYINQNLPTSAFELSFLSYGKEIEGWLTDLNKKTQYYAIVWLWATNEKNPSVSEITQAEVLLIDRQKILGYLAQEGLSLEGLRHKTREIRALGVYGVLEKSYEKDYYFYFTEYLSEKPVNVIIRKKKLLELAHSVFKYP